MAYAERGTGPTSSVSERSYRHLRRYLWIVHLSLLTHAALVAATFPMHSTDVLKHVAAFSCQAIALAITLFSFLLLSSRTLFIRAGLYDRFVKEFKWLFATALVAFSVFFAFNIFNLILVLDNVDHLSVWRTPGYVPLYISQKISMLFYYAIMTISNFRVTEERFYSVESLQFTY